MLKRLGVLVDEGFAFGGNLVGVSELVAVHVDHVWVGVNVLAEQVVVALQQVHPLFKYIEVVVIAVHLRLGKERLILVSLDHVLVVLTGHEGVRDSCLESSDWASESFNGDQHVGSLGHLQLVAGLAEELSRHVVGGDCLAKIRADGLHGGSSVRGRGWGVGAAGGGCGVEGLGRGGWGEDTYGESRGDAELLSHVCFCL